MSRWLAIGAVFGFSVAVLLVSVFGGPGEPPAAPAVDAGAPTPQVKLIPALAAPIALPSAARRVGSLSEVAPIEIAGPARPGRALPGVADSADAGR